MDEDVDSLLTDSPCNEDKEFNDVVDDEAAKFVKGSVRGLS